MLVAQLVRASEQSLEDPGSNYFSSFSSLFLQRLLNPQACGRGLVKSSSSLRISTFQIKLIIPHFTFLVIGRNLALFNGFYLSNPLGYWELLWVQLSGRLELWLRNCCCVISTAYFNCKSFRIPLSSETF